MSGSRVNCVCLTVIVFWLAREVWVRSAAAAKVWRAWLRCGGGEEAATRQTWKTKSGSLSGASRLGPADWKPVIADRKQNWARTQKSKKCRENSVLVKTEGPIDPRGVNPFCPPSITPPPFRWSQQRRGEANGYLGSVAKTHRAPRGRPSTPHFIRGARTRYRQPFTNVWGSLRGRSAAAAAAGLYSPSPGGGRCFIDGLL